MAHNSALLLGDSCIKKTVLVEGSFGKHQPAVGDEVQLNFLVRESLANEPSPQALQLPIFQRHSKWRYRVGIDDVKFLPSRFAEIILGSMSVGETSQFRIDVRCLVGANAFLGEPPWLRVGSSGFERVDVEEVEYEIQLLSLRRPGDASVEEVVDTRTSSTLHKKHCESAGAKSRQLPSRRRREEQKRRRAARWFDGAGCMERTRAASDARVCSQCTRLCQEGLLPQSPQAVAGRYFCRSCWECWSKIRRSQQKHLDRRVEKATYSDYSTATDELPSLDEAPKSWDSHHPMWSREHQGKPNWQLSHLSESERCDALLRSARHQARMEVEKQREQERSQQETEAADAKDRADRVATASKFFARSLRLASAVSAGRAQP